MDIEFIEMEHRENVIQLMEICGLDMNQAYQLYTNSGNNLEVIAFYKILGSHTKTTGRASLRVPTKYSRT